MDVWTHVNTITHLFSFLPSSWRPCDQLQFAHISCNSYRLQEEPYSCKCTQQTRMSWISALNCSETAFHCSLKSYHGYQYVWHIKQWFSEACRFTGYILQEFIWTVSNLFWIIMKEYDHFHRYSFYFQIMWGLLQWHRGSHLTKLQLHAR